MSLAKRRIEKALKPRKPAPCPICQSRSGLCVMATFVPESWWQRSRSTRRRSK